MSTEAEVLRSVAHHRYLSGAQVRAIHFADASSPRVAEVQASRALNALRSAGLVESAGARGPSRRGEKIWFATRAGLQAAGVTRPYQPTKEKALALQEHSLAVNEVGLAFLEAARARGDDFGPLGWEHEIPLSRAGANLVVADALLSYVGRNLFAGDSGQYGVTAIVELESGAHSDHQVVAKLQGFAQVQAQPALWASRFAHGWPTLLMVFASPAGAAQIARVCTLWPGGLPVLFATLADLRTRGPFAAIWRDRDRSEGLDWLGEPECSTLAP